MPGTIVEKTTCELCGTEVRDGSAFCYNCGETINIGPPPPPIVKPATGTLNGRRRRGEKTLAYADPEPAPILMPSGPPVIIDEQPVEKTSVPVAERMRRPRPVKKTHSPVQVEWVENAGSSLLFIIGTVVLTLIAVGFLVLAMYLK